MVRTYLCVGTLRKLNRIKFNGLALLVSTLVSSSDAHSFACGKCVRRCYSSLLIQGFFARLNLKVVVILLSSFLVTIEYLNLFSFFIIELKRIKKICRTS